MTPAGFHRPENPFTKPCPVITRQAAWNALRAQAERLEAQRLITARKDAQK